MAAPIATMNAISSAAANGIIIKDASSLDSLPNVDCIGTDKTGTLTQGSCSVVHSVYTGSLKKEHVYVLMTAVERQSTHPLANAIIKFAIGCVSSKIDTDNNTGNNTSAMASEAKEVKVVDGGITATVGEYNVMIGNKLLMKNANNFNSLKKINNEYER